MKTHLQGVELRLDPDPLCTSCQISTINQKARYKIPLQSKTPFKWVFMEIILEISSNILTKDTTFYNSILILGAYSKLPILYGMVIITTEEAMGKLDMFQDRFGK